MNKNEIINLEDIQSEYSFYLTKQEGDKYFCSCGESFISSHEEDVMDLEQTLSMDDDMDDEIQGIYKEIKFALDKKILCPHCNKNYNDPDVRMKLIPIGKYFISGYEFEETKSHIRPLKIINKKLWKVIQFSDFPQRHP